MESTAQQKKAVLQTGGDKIVASFDSQFINMAILRLVRSRFRRTSRKYDVLHSLEVEISAHLFAKRSDELEIDEMKKVFLKSAVHVVARDGLDKVTTKAIAKEAHLNEAYIYKCYSGKDELLNEALHMEDENFAVLLHEILPVMHDPRLPWKSRAFILWKRSWDFILEEPDDCVFYIKFYFASIGLNVVYRKHLASYQPLVEKIRPSFKPGTNMEMVVHQIFCTMLFYASRVMDGDLAYNEETTQWVFEQIYCFIVPHVRPELLEPDN